MANKDLSENTTEKNRNGNASSTTKKDKKSKRDKKKNRKEKQGGELEEETLGSKVVLVIVTLVIIVIWLAIIAILIKADVGGFGSSVLYPALKDVPVINKILPEGEQALIDDTQYQYETLDDAVERIKELELQLTEATDTNESNAQTIKDLQDQIDELVIYKDEQATFETEKEKFYEEVVFSDVAPDIKEYKTYYESIDPANAEVLYKQVVEQITYSQEVEDYALTYSSMKASAAAAIFDTMTDDLDLVADILLNMDTQSRADILAEMNEETAAILTQIMEPQ